MKKKHHIVFRTVASEWLADVKLRVKRSSYEKYVYILDKHILPFFGSYSMGQLSVRSVDRFMLEKLTDGKLKRNEGISRKYLQDMLSIIKSITYFAEYTYNIPCRINRIRGVKTGKPKTRTLNRTEKERLTKELKTDTSREKLGIMLALYTGMRIGEVCGLKWSDFDADAGTITINRTVQRISDNNGGTVFIVSTPKTEASKRVIPLPDFLLKLLRKMKGNDESPVISNDSTYTEPSRLRRIFRRISAKCGISAMRFHDLRHSFASECVRMKCDIKMLSEILGHTSVSMTLDRYVHSDPEEKRKFMQLIQV